MITDALILGGAGAAVYRDAAEDGLRALRIVPETERVEDCTAHLGFLLNMPGERRIPDPVPRDATALVEDLRAWSRRHRALSLMLSGMDTALGDATRAGCIRAASPLLSRDDVRSFVRGRILGTPPPDEADIAGARARSRPKPTRMRRHRCTEPWRMPPRAGPLPRCAKRWPM